MSEAKKPTAETTAKRIDVTSHDEPATDGVAKAVVITSRPILKAPTATAPTDGETDPSVQTAPPLPTTGAKSQTVKQQVKPLVPGPEATSAASEKSDSNQEPAKPAVTPTGTNTATPATTPAPDTTPPQPDKSAQEGKPSDDAASDDADTKDAPQTEEELNAEAEAQVKHDEAIQKLVDSKQYYLPINAVELRKTKHFVVLGALFSVVLLLTWTDIALDAGLVKIPGVKPLTHFFSN